MVGVVNVVESKIVGAARLLNLRAVSVGLPRNCVDIHKVLDHNHPAVERTFLKRAGAVECADRTYEVLALWINGLAVGAAENDGVVVTKGVAATPTTTTTIIPIICTMPIPVLIRACTAGSSFIFIVVVLL